jgi:hypothetical protein
MDPPQLNNYNDANDASENGNNVPREQIGKFTFLFLFVCKQIVLFSIFV